MKKIGIWRITLEIRISHWLNSTNTSYKMRKTESCLKTSSEWWKPSRVWMMNRSRSYSKELNSIKLNRNLSDLDSNWKSKTSRLMTKRKKLTKGCVRKMSESWKNEKNSINNTSWSIVKTLDSASNFMTRLLENKKDWRLNEWWIGNLTTIAFTNRSLNKEPTNKKSTNSTKNKTASNGSISSCNGKKLRKRRRE